MIQDWLKRLRAFWNAGRRNQVTVAASGIILIALIIGSIALLGNRSGNTTAHGIAQATATPLQATATASAPQPTPTQVSTTVPLPSKPVNQAIIGGTETGFTAVFGKPISTGVDSGNNLPTVDYRGNGPIGGITIELDSSRSYVVGIVISAPQNAPFDATNLQPILLHFAPSDATYDSAAPITNGSNQDVALFQLGHSPLLAHTIPESAFTDYQGQPVLAGTFSTEIYYIEGADGKLAYATSLRLGNWPSSPAT
ncbi:MAG: hypothetical protein ACM3N4_05860 [Nitrososphaerota archaeon]